MVLRVCLVLGDSVIKKAKSELAIIDATGRVLHRAFVENPVDGLKGADLSGLMAPLGQFQGLDLSGAYMYWATLGDADLSFANLSSADLRGAMLDRAKCTSTNFRGCNMGRDNLGGRTILRGADLSTADLQGARLDGAVYDDETRFPPRFDPHSHGMTHVDDLPTGDAGRI
jgi:uncharacterized protein YjbI with pentapeptide repeats